MNRILILLFLPLIMLYIAACFYQQTMQPQPVAPVEPELDDGREGLYEYF
jgi:hypothetical protein